MRSYIRDYVTENPGTDYHAIVNRFGHPQKIAESYIVELEPKEILQIVQLRQRIFQMLLVAVIVIATVWCGFTAAAYIDHFNDMNGVLVVGAAEEVSSITNE